jgi:hypothetical protein
MAAEFLKYGGDELHEAIAVLLNAVFINHESIPDLKAGLLLALNKPSPKKTIVEHTRSIILLTALRKVLSLIVYSRIGGKVGAFLPLNQHAYLPGRSTGEFFCPSNIFVRSRNVTASVLTSSSLTSRKPLTASIAPCSLRSSAPTTSAMKTSSA